MPRWPQDPQDFLALDPSQQADWLLLELDGVSEGSRGRNAINNRLHAWYPELHGIGVVSMGPGLQRMKDGYQRAKEEMEESYEQLMQDGSIVPDPSSGRTFCRISRVGRTRLAEMQTVDPARITFARTHLTIALDPALESRDVRSHFLQGKYETALRDGAVFLEDAIRTLSGLSGTGGTLSQQAFGSKGVLRNTAVDPGQASGEQKLFEGFFGAIRNLVGHKDYRYPDPVDALQALMLLDLLTRRLRASATRIGKGLS